MKKNYLTIIVPIFAVICYMLFYLYSVPKFLFLRSDDFGYLDSLVISLKNHKIVTSQFLEPPNLFSTLSGYSIFKITKSIYLAVTIPLFISTVLTFTLLFLSLNKYYKYIQAIMFTLLIMTLPTVINISFDVTGIMTSWAAFILSIYLWEKRQIALFFAVVFLAAVNRQSNLVLLVFPFFSLFAFKSKVNKKPVLLLFIFTLIALSGVFFVQGTTLAQKQSMLNPVILNHYKFVNYGLSAFVYGVLFFILSVTFYSFLSFPLFFLKTLKRNIQFFYLPLAFTAVFVLTFFLLGQSVHFQTPILNQNLNSLNILQLLLFLAIWFFPWQYLKINIFLLCGLAFIILNSIRGLWYDYYFFELLILAFYYYRDTAGPSLKRINLNYLLLIVTPIICLNSIFYINFKYYLDLEGLKVRLFEKALRQNIISVSSLRDAPFGYQAWKLFDFSQQNGEKPITEFLCYLKSNPDLSITIGEKIANPKSIPNQIGEGEYKLGFKKTNYYIRKTGTNSNISKCHGDEKYLPGKLKKYKNKIFPLNDREWLEYLSI